MSDNNIFQRNPKKTILIVLIIPIVLIDTICGLFFIPKNYNNFRIGNSYFHHNLCPNFSGITRFVVGNKSYGHEYMMNTNSLGFIDHSVRKVELTTKKTRILFMGDSFIEGLCINFDNTFTGILCDKFDKEKYEILNAAVVSYAPRIYYLKTQYLLEYVKLKFNKLVVFIDISDIEDEVSYSDFQPRFDPNDYYFHAYNNIKYTSDELPTFNEFSKNHSFIYHSIFQYIKNQKEKKSYSQLYKATKPSEQIEPPTKETEMKFKPYSWNSVTDYWVERDNWTSNDSVVYRKWGRIGLKLAEGNMIKLNKLCNNYNIPMTIVVYPWKKQIMDGDLNCIQVKFWEQFCINNHIQFINLFPAFINGTPAEVVRDKYFVPEDNHWNKVGHQLVADFLYKEFEKSW
jgi:hypothetical protein